MTSDEAAAPASSTGTALLTDHYELTMLRAALHSGKAHRRAVFEMFARHLPNGRRYGVVAGTGRLLDALERYRFGEWTLQGRSRSRSLGSGNPRTPDGDIAYGSASIESQRIAQRF